MVWKEIFFIIGSVAFLLSFGIFFSPKINLSPSVPFGYAPPWDVFDNNHRIFFLDSNANGNYLARVIHSQAYIYNKGYYWNKNQNKWVEFTFEGVPIPNTHWIPEQAQKTFDLSSLGLSSEDFYVVAYTCKKHNNVWKCGCIAQDDCGYWMYQTPGFFSPENPSENNTNATTNDSSNEIPPSIEQSQIIFYNGSQKIASFTKTGSIALKGTCTISSCSNPQPNSAIFKNNSGSILAYIDGLGNLCVKSSAQSCEELKNETCLASSDDFIVKDDNGNNIIVIGDNSQVLCYTGTLQENLNEIPSLA